MATDKPQFYHSAPLPEVFSFEDPVEYRVSEGRASQVPSSGFLRPGWVEVRMDDASEQALEAFDAAFGGESGQATLAGHALKAREFAVARHGMQAYGRHPYAYHLDAVAAILAPYGVVAQTVGYLHDVVEDTNASLDDLRALFGNLVAECVSIVTDAPGATRKERKKATYERMSTVDGVWQLALLVKAADRLANIRSCLADGNDRLLQVYREEHEALRAAAYRPGQCNELWDELAELINR